MVTHNERVLELLSDGKPHSHHEGYALHVMLHSRVSDLRREGHDIRCWREGDLYLYMLVPLRRAEGIRRMDSQSSVRRNGDGEGSDRANILQPQSSSHHMSSRSGPSSPPGGPCPPLDQGPPLSLFDESEAA